jgi:hypothetical protein
MESYRVMFTFTFQRKEDAMENVSLLFYAATLLKFMQFPAPSSASVGLYSVPSGNTSTSNHSFLSQSNYVLIKDMHLFQLSTVSHLAYSMEQSPYGKAGSASSSQEIS